MLLQRKGASRIHEIAIELLQYCRPSASLHSMNCCTANVNPDDHPY